MAWLVSLIKLVVIGAGWLFVVIGALFPVILLWGFVCWLLWKLIHYIFL